MGGSRARLLPPPPFCLWKELWKWCSITPRFFLEVFKKGVWVVDRLILKGASLMGQGGGGGGEGRGINFSLFLFSQGFFLFFLSFFFFFFFFVRVGRSPTKTISQTVE